LLPVFDAVATRVVEKNYKVIKIPVTLVAKGVIIAEITEKPCNYCNDSVLPKNTGVIL